VVNLKNQPVGNAWPDVAACLALRQFTHFDARSTGMFHNHTPFVAMALNSSRDILVSLVLRNNNNIAVINGALGEMLKEFVSLKHLDLRAIGIGTEGARETFQMLNTSVLSGLEYLSISSNDIGYSGGELFYSVLLQFTRLVRLYVQFNNMSNQTIYDIAFHLCRFNKSLIRASFKEQGNGYLTPAESIKMEEWSCLVNV